MAEGQRTVGRASSLTAASTLASFLVKGRRRSTGLTGNTVSAAKNPMILQAWLALPSCFASSSTPTLYVGWNHWGRKRHYSNLVDRLIVGSLPECESHLTQPPASRPLA
jgi:hypothetical protein